MCKSLNVAANKCINLAFLYCTECCTGRTGVQYVREFTVRQWSAQREKLWLLVNWSGQTRWQSTSQVTTPCLKKLSHFYFWNSSVKHWPILIILARNIAKKLDVNDYTFAYLNLRGAFKNFCKSICWTEKLFKNLYTKITQVSVTVGLCLYCRRYIALVIKKKLTWEFWVNFAEWSL